MSALGIDRLLAAPALTGTGVPRAGDRSLGFGERLDERLDAAQTEPRTDSDPALDAAQPEPQSEPAAGPTDEAQPAETPRDEQPQGPSGDDPPEAPQQPSATDAGSAEVAGARPDDAAEVVDRGAPDAAPAQTPTGGSVEAAPERFAPQPGPPADAAALSRGAAVTAEAIARAPLRPATALGILAAGPLDIASLNALLLRLDPRVAEPAAGAEAPASDDAAAQTRGASNATSAARASGRQIAAPEVTARFAPTDVLDDLSAEPDTADPLRGDATESGGAPREPRAGIDREPSPPIAGPHTEGTPRAEPPARALGLGVGVAAAPGTGPGAAAPSHAGPAAITSTQRQDPATHLALTATRSDRAPAQRTDNEPRHTPARAAIDAQLTRGVSAALAQRPGPVLLRLAPEELGQVRVHVDVRGAAVGVRVEAASESARGLLALSQDSLRAALERQGLSLASIRVEVSDALAEPGVGGGTGVAEAPPAAIERESERTRSGARRRPRERGE
ncbi:MAG: hypothetical protein C0513_05530 [Isosphaera sp.]|nr:hypothetical protein [Isosphaera sp.]